MPSFQSKGYRKCQKKNAVNDQKLEEAYRIIAKIVSEHDEKYLALFKRVHEEREIRKASRGLKNIALQIAQRMTD